MDLEFEQKADFFLDLNGPRKIPGILKYFKNQYIEIELFGSLSALVSEPFSYKWNYGESINGSKITLSDVTNLTTEYGNGFDFSTWTAKFLFIGGRFSTVAEPIAISSTFSNFTSWIGKKYFSRKKAYNFISTLKILQIKDVLFNVLDEGEFKIYHGLNSKNGANEISLSNGAYLKITKRNIGFEELFRGLSWFNSFVSLSTYSRSSIEIGYLYYDDYEPKILRFYVGKSKSNLPVYPKHNFYLFKHQDLANSFKRIVYSWYSKRSKLSVSINLLLNYVQSQGEFSEADFMNVIHALENFHRSVRRNTVLSNLKHTSRIKEIEGSVPKKHLDFLRSRMINSNEPSLHQRLEWLIEEFGLTIFKKVVSDETQFVRDVKNSRNYYTHFSKQLEGKALMGKELFYLTEKLKILLISGILRELGFSIAAIDRIVRNNEHNVFASLAFEEF